MAGREKGEKGEKGSRLRNKKIWNYFERLSDSVARCHKCRMHLSCKHTSANLVRHLFYRHQVDASYYGAEKTGFLQKTRVGKFKRRSAKSYKGADNDKDEHIKANGNDSSIDSTKSATDMANVKIEIECREAMKDPAETNYSDYEGVISAARGYLLDVVSEQPLDPLCEYQMEALSMPVAQQSQSSTVNNRNATTSTATSVGDQTLTKPKVEQTPPVNIHIVEKLKAETRYYNEMADLALAKRNLIDLQSQKLRLELEMIGTS